MSHEGGDVYKALGAGRLDRIDIVHHLGLLILLVVLLSVGDALVVLSAVILFHFFTAHFHFN